jgi:hypothetical protein
MLSYLTQIIQRTRAARHWNSLGVDLSADAVAVSARFGVPWRSASPGSLTPRQLEFLAKTLRGHRAEQPCWANERYRQHALSSVAEHFADDWDCCVQALHAVYTLNPGSMRRIDRIIRDHVESRTGTHPPSRYQTRGWNPAEALAFMGDSDTFWRCYRASDTVRWFSVELPIKPQSEMAIWNRSGYRIYGHRGCARSLSFRRIVEADEAPHYAESFMHAARPLIDRVAPTADATTLWNAVHKQVDFEGYVGSLRAKFRKHILQGDHGAKHTVEYALDLEHP